MAVFCLFHLPLVAMEHVLSTMNAQQLIDLSMVSVRSKNAVTNFLRIRRKLRVLLGVLEEPYISIAGKQRLFHRIFKYSENPIEEWMKTYDYIRKVLGFRFEYVRFEFDSFPSQNRQIINYLLLIQTSIDRLEVISGREKCNDDVQYLLNNLKVFDRLVLQLNHYKEDSQLDIPNDPHYLHINNSKFINYEQFLKLTHVKIAFNLSILTNQEINRFLKSWMACESHYKLEVFQVNIPNQEAIEEIMDLPHEVTTDPSIMNMFVGLPFNINPTEGFNIKRSDGKMATACVAEKSNGWNLCLLIH
uniref:F-box domain-containing protein n=2 Tax=Caenorhabditis tropicalis TaxID=1561998 RepID=A0A1I7TI34_9PELO